MEGTLIWYSAERRQGIIEVIENGIMQKYFLLKSKIARSPEIVKTGQFVKFTPAPPPKPGLLPMAWAVEVSDTPFVDAGVDALKAGV